MDFRGVRFCEVRDGRSLPSLDLSAIWPARSTPTLADLFAHLDRFRDARIEALTVKHGLPFGMHVEAQV